MFELLKTDAISKARLGRLTTAHGVAVAPAQALARSPIGT